MSDMPSRSRRIPIHEKIVNQTTGRKERRMRKHLAITAVAGAAALIGGVIMVSVALAGDDDRSGDRMGFYKQTNLVANKAGLGARTIDPNLVNPWGMAWA